MNLTAAVFLSHASEDEQHAESLHGRLTAAGFDPWMNTLDIRPGEFWVKSIEEAIHQCDFFLALLSQNSVSRSGFFDNELRLALRLQRIKGLPADYIVPVRLDECTMPSPLRSFQRVELYEPNGFAQLVNSMKRGMAGRWEDSISAIESTQERARQLVHTVSGPNGASWIRVGPMIEYLRSVLLPVRIPLVVPFGAGEDDHLHLSDYQDQSWSLLLPAEVAQLICREGREFIAAPVEGDSMESKHSHEAGIQHGSVAMGPRPGRQHIGYDVVRHGDVVIVEWPSGLVKVRQYLERGREQWLVPFNDSYESVRLKEGMEILTTVGTVICQETWQQWLDDCMWDGTHDSLTRTCNDKL